jgi:hypothetical protein
VTDGYLLGSDEDVLDDGAQDPLAVLGGGGGRVGAAPGEESFEVVGEFQVGVEALRSGLAGAEVRHAGAELVDGEELLGERGDHRADRRAGLGEGLAGSRELTNSH